MSDFKQRLLEDPFNHDLRAEYAESLIVEGDFDAAIQQFHIILKADPDNALAQQRLQTLQSDKASREAEGEHSQQSNDIDKRQPEALHQGRSGLSVVASNEAPHTGNVVSIASTDSVRFADIAGMVDAKKIVKRRIIDPFINPGLFSSFKRSSGGGVLLYGPPGCGKTMLAKAIASECDANFISVGISDVLSMFKGESEMQLASVFERARANRPAVLFFDELDALAYSRSKASSDHTRTLVNEFLNQLDGSQTDNEKILILGATNMPWDVDDAMKRPGRFDRQVFVPPLDADARAALLEQKMVGIPQRELPFKEIAQRCDYFSGADLDALIELAKDIALDDLMDGNSHRVIELADFAQALEQITPTTVDWLKTARNLVKFGNAGGSYKEVEKYLKSIKQY